ncbi:MAG TPA: MFS transporter [Acetobacteraceae bacterium]|nr:MFS transporter [Acetobacteraceae bacterium]
MFAVSGGWLVAVLCGAEVLTMVGFSAWAVLLAPLRDLWSLSNSGAGTIGGMFFAGYTLAVPFLVSMTDRVGSRRVWLIGASLIVIGTGGFALFAHGLATAAVFQAVAGAGLAGTYMPGLRLLSDHLQRQAQSRAVALYTASFGIGTSVSYLAADQLARAFGWRMAFLVPACTTALAIALVLLTVRAAAPGERVNPLRGIGAVLRHRNAIAYSCAYFAHSWEVYTVRSWVIAFLSFIAVRHGRMPGWPSPAHIAFGMSVLGIFSILIGNESAIRFGRKRTVVALMCASASVGAAVGIVQGLYPGGQQGSWLPAAYPMVAVLVLLYGPLMTSESAVVTAGALGNAIPGYRGTTLAVHSMLGFAGGVVGPIVFGATLDLAGGAGREIAWTAAYIVLAALTLLGPLAIAILRPRELPGDRRGQLIERR